MANNTSGQDRKGGTQGLTWTPNLTPRQRRELAERRAAANRATAANNLRAIEAAARQLAIECDCLPRRDAIAHVAGVSPRTVYRLLPTSADLVRASGFKLRKR